MSSTSPKQQNAICIHNNNVMLQYWYTKNFYFVDFVEFFFLLMLPPSPEATFS